MHYECLDGNCERRRPQASAVVTMLTSLGDRSAAALAAFGSEPRSALLLQLRCACATYSVTAAAARAVAQLCRQEPHHGRWLAASGGARCPFQQGSVGWVWLTQPVPWPFEHLSVPASQLISSESMELRLRGWTSAP